MDKLEQIDRLRWLKQYQWLCADLSCDGKPHAGMPHRHARASQRVPGEAYIHAWFTGRGFGKTRSAAEWIKTRMLAEPNHRVNIVAPTFGGGRDICVEGESGLLAVLPPDRIASWSRSLGELVLKNGSRAKIFGAHSRDDSDSIRGSQSHSLWSEELASWRHQENAWDMALFANRLGRNAKVVVTSTPRPTPLIRKLFKMDNALIVGGSTLENEDNLAPSYLDHLLATYSGTRLGQQELEGLLLNDVEGALWTRDMIRSTEKAPDLVRIVVAIDPPGGHRIGHNAKAGIVVAGVAADGLLYVLADRSDYMSPEIWAKTALDLYDEYEADCVVAEVNFGSEMVRSVLNACSSHAKFKAVRASRGKALRAEPVVSLYERKRVFHVGLLPALEDQQCSWVPPGQVSVDSNGIETPLPGSDYSPDSIDALVWAITDLALRPKRRRVTMRFTPATGVAS